MNKRARTLFGAIILIAFVIASSIFIVSITKGEDEEEKETLGEEEIISQRTQNAKVFELPEAGKYRVEAQIGVIHYKENPDDPAELWKDINTTITDLKVTKAPYIAEFNLSSPKFKINHRKGGYLIEETVDEDGNPIEAQGILEGNKITYSNVFEDVDIEIIALNYGVKQNLIVKNKKALKNVFKIELDSDEDGEVLNEKQIEFGSLIEIVRVYDANGKEVNFEREYENESEKEKIKEVNFTTDYKKESEKKKIKIKVEDIGELAFPVTIDPTVMPQEQVGASSDDAGESDTGYMGLDDTSMYFGADAFGDPRYNGIRFQTVPIPLGATIESASMDVYASHTSARYTPNVKIYGEAIDDAPTFTTTSKNITNRIKTQNYSLWNTTIGSGWYGTPDLSKAVEEITNRSGWAEHNDLAFLIYTYEQIAFQYVEVRTWDWSTSLAPKFSCTYTIPPPAVSTPAIIPADTYAYEDDTLNCSVNATNNDTTKINVSFIWYKNDTQQTDYDNTTECTNATTCYSKNNVTETLKKDDIWRCEANPNDGTHNGTKRNSSSVTIRSYNITGCGALNKAGATYSLKANISNSTTRNCIDITANNITLDCRDNIIDGDDSADRGIYVYRASAETTNITIRNCELIDWDSGNIYLGYANSNTLINITSTSSPDYGIYLTYANNNTLANITANSNKYGILLSSGCRNNTFTNITANSNSYSGFRFGSSDNNTLKDIIANDNDDYGFYFEYSDDNTFTNVTASNTVKYEGFYIIYSNINTFTNVTANNNTRYGIQFYSSAKNTLIDTKLINNTIYDFYVYMDEFPNCDHNFTNVTGTDDKPIVYYNGSAVTIEHWNNNVSEIVLCYASKSTFYNVTLQHTDKENNGILLAGNTVNVNFTNVSVRDLYDGIRLSGNNNILINVTANSNANYGINLGAYDSNTLTNVTANSNTAYGIYLYYGSSSNTIKESEFFNNTDAGIFFDGSLSNSNLIYNNLFNNTLNFDYGNIGANFWNTTKQTGDRIIGDGPEIGGNYWANLTGDGYSETCTDTNIDGFCDTAYTLAPDNIDYHPLSDGYLPDVWGPKVENASFNDTSANQNDYVRLNVTVADTLLTVDTVITTMKYPNATSTNYTMGFLYLTQTPDNSEDKEAGTIQKIADVQISRRYNIITNKGGFLRESYADLDDDDFVAGDFSENAIGYVLMYNDTKLPNDAIITDAIFSVSYQYNSFWDDISYFSIFNQEDAITMWNDATPTWAEYSFTNVKYSFASNTGVPGSSEVYYDYSANQTGLDYLQEVLVTDNSNNFTVTHHASSRTDDEYITFHSGQDGDGDSEANPPYFIINYTEINSTAAEATTTYTTYTDIDSTTWDNVTKVNVSVYVDVYDSTGSGNNSNNNPDLELWIYNGSEYRPVSNFSVSATGNYSVATTDSNIISGWNTTTNRDLKIRGVDFDYNSSTIIDEINWTEVWVIVDYQDKIDDWYTYVFTDTSATGTYNVTHIIANDTLSNVNDTTYTDLTFNVTRSTPPVVNLTSPANATWINDSTPDFKFNVTDGENLTFDCYLYVNSSDGYGNGITYASYGRNNSVSNGTSTTIIANSTLKDGHHTWYVNCSEIGHANLSSQSQIWNLSIDTVYPLLAFDTGTLANDSFRNQTSIYANWSYTEANLQNITAELYNTTGLVNRTGFTTATYEINWTITNTNERYYYNISILDNAGNFNKTEPRNITIDTTNPTIPTVSLTPDTVASLDPNVQINVTANISDATSDVNTTILQYKFHTSATFSNATMRYNSTTKLYNANFTPTISGNWEYRIWANDSAGNYYNTTATNVTAEYDWTWVAGKNESGAISGILTTNREIIIIDINNTGDYSLSFDLSDNSPTGMTYSDDLFSIASGGKKNVSINATFSPSTRDDDVIITIDSTTASASPSERTVNVTLTSYAGGPYFDVAIDTYPTSINQSRTAIIRAYVKNIGNETSIQTWLNWTLPSGVTNTTGNLTQNVTLNETSNLTAGSRLYNTLNITVNETTVEIGSMTIYAKATGLNSTGSVISKEVNKSITITCYSGDSVCGLGCNYHTDTDCEIPQNITTTTTTAGGGGGGVPFVFKAEVTYELVRGRDQIFILPLENTYSSKTLTNIRVSASGYLAQYIKIEPPENVSADETGEIKVKILAPSYFTVGMHNLTFTIQSVAKEKGTSDISKTEKRYVHLAIHELGKGDSVNLINEIENYLNKLKRLNLKTEGIQELFDKSLDALNKSNYEKVNEMYEQSKELAEAALDSYSIVKGLEEKLNDTSKYKIKTPKTDRLVNLAKSALERGDYLLASERVKDAQLTYIIETKGKFGLIYYIRKNTFEFFLYTIAIVILLTFLYLRTKIGVINYNLKGLQQEEDTLLGLMKVVQKECFEEKKMSMNEYNDAMLQYEDKLSKAVQKTIELEAGKANLLKFKHRKLELERNRLLDLMKTTQEKYLKEGAIETQVYNNKMHSFVSRLSALEENLALQEAKQTLRKRKLFWRMFYSIFQAKPNARKKQKKD